MTSKKSLGINCVATMAGGFYILLALVSAPVAETLEDGTNYVDYLRQYVESGLRHLDVEKQEQRRGRIYHFAQQFRNASPDIQAKIYDQGLHLRKGMPPASQDISQRIDRAAAGAIDFVFGQVAGPVLDAAALAREIIANEDLPSLGQTVVERINRPSVDIRLRYHPSRFCKGLCWTEVASVYERAEREGRGGVLLGNLLKEADVLPDGAEPPITGVLSRQLSEIATQLERSATGDTERAPETPSQPPRQLSEIATQLERSATGDSRQVPETPSLPQGLGGEREFTLSEKEIWEFVAGSLADLETVDEDKLGHIQAYYAQPLTAIQRRQARADLFESVGFFVSFANPDLGRAIGVGLPAAERFMDGMAGLLAGGSLLAVVDLAGGAAALVKLVHSVFVKPKPDPVLLAMRGVQKQLAGLARRIELMDQKLNHVVQMLADLAGSSMDTQDQLAMLSERLEEIHTQVKRELEEILNRQNRQTLYLREILAKTLKDEYRNLDKCLAQAEFVWPEGPYETWSEEVRARYVDCRTDAIAVMTEVAKEKVYTGHEGLDWKPQHIRQLLKENGGSADWLAARWAEAANTVLEARRDAVSRPKRESRANIDITVATPDVVVNPAIWAEGIRVFRTLEEFRPKEIDSSAIVQRITDFGKSMMNIVDVVTTNNLASDVVLLHQWNGHRLIKVLRALWDEYLDEYLKEEYRVAARSEETLPWKPGSRDKIYARWEFNRRLGGKLVFDYWISDFEPANLVNQTPENQSAMARALRVDQNVLSVRPETPYENPTVTFWQNADIAHGAVRGRGLWGGALPTVLGRIGARWSGCLRVGFEHTLKGRNTPYATEYAEVCTSDSPVYDNWLRLVNSDYWDALSGGGFSRDFARKYDVTERGGWAGVPLKSYCRIRTSEQTDYEYEGQPFRNDFLYVPEGALVFDGHLPSERDAVLLTFDGTRFKNVIDKIHIGKSEMLAPNVDFNEDGVRAPVYNPPQFKPGEPINFSKYPLGRQHEGCVFYRLWGFGDDDNLPADFFLPEDAQGSLYRVTRTQGKRFANPAYTFNASTDNVKWLKTHLGELVYRDEFENMIWQLRKDLESDIVGRWKRSERAKMKKQGIRVDVGEFEQAAAAVMRKFLKWALDNGTLDVELEFYSNSSDKDSLDNVVRRLNESWLALQVLTRISAGNCELTSGGLQILLEDVASGNDAETFLRMLSDGRSFSDSDPFRSWSQLRVHGLFGVTGNMVADSDHLPIPPLVTYASALSGDVTLVAFRGASVDEVGKLGLALEDKRAIGREELFGRDELSREEKSEIRDFLDLIGNEPGFEDVKRGGIGTDIYFGSLESSDSLEVILSYIQLRDTIGSFPPPPLMYDLWRRQNSKYIPLKHVILIVSQDVATRMIDEAIRETGAVLLREHLLQVLQEATGLSLTNDILQSTMSERDVTEILKRYGVSNNRIAKLLRLRKQFSRNYFGNVFYHKHEMAELLEGVENAEENLSKEQATRILEEASREQILELFRAFFLTDSGIALRLEESEITVTQKDDSTYVSLTGGKYFWHDPMEETTYRSLKENIADRYKRLVTDNRLRSYRWEGLDPRSVPNMWIGSGRDGRFRSYFVLKTGEEIKVQGIPLLWKVEGNQELMFIPYNLWSYERPKEVRRLRHALTSTFGRKIFELLHREPPCQSGSVELEEGLRILEELQRQKG